MNVLKDIGKTTVCVQKDIPGFVGNRLQHALWREAISLVENGVCDAESVDTVVKSSFGRRLAVLGPLEKTVASEANEEAEAECKLKPNYNDTKRFDFT